MKTPLRAALDRLYPDALAFLKALVEINSHTPNRAGIDENAERITAQFQPLGFTAKRVPADGEEYADHLFLDSGGEGPAIAFVSHLDTVFSAEETAQNDFLWREENGRIYGPGTIDIKGGTALIWLMLKALAETDPELFHSVRWLIAWDSREETGASQAFAETCHTLFPADLLACLVVEPDNSDLPGGFSLLNARKGVVKMEVTATGRAAHAGVNHPHGASAIRQLARMIETLEGLTDHQAGITVNVGLVEGGTGPNRVPHHASARFEMRAYDPDLFEQTIEKIMGLGGVGDVRSAKDGFPCSTALEVLQFTPTWPENDATHRLLTFWQQAADDLKIPFGFHPRGGVSDGNFLAQWYPVVDGVGPCGANAHCSERSADGTKEQEYIVAASLVPKAELNLGAIIRLLRAAATEPAR